jgi:hypothetical protein
VPGHECFFFLGDCPGSSFLHSAPQGVFAYVGLGTGPELLPYLLALLAWAGAALLAILQWPLSKIVRRLKSRRRNLQQDTMLGDARATAATETPRESNPSNSGP